MSTELDLLGRLVMANLRDEPLEFFDGLLRRHWKADAYKELQADLSKLSTDQKTIARRALLAAADTSIHAFLFALQEAIDSGDVEILIKGKNVADMTDGLHGEPFTVDGWQARFSKLGQAPEHR